MSFNFPHQNILYYILIILLFIKFSFLCNIGITLLVVSSIFILLTELKYLPYILILFYMKIYLKYQFIIPL